MRIDNYRILKIDDFNYVFEEKRKKVKEDVEIEEWKRCRGYYGTITECLNSIKNYIVSTYVNELDKFEDVLEKINELNKAYVECEILCNCKGE